jgi:hypothetical protein
VIYAKIVAFLQTPYLSYTKITARRMPKNANQKNKLVNSVNLCSQKAIMVSITVQLWSIYFLLILKLLSTNQYQLLLTCDSNFATNMLLKPTLFTLLALCGCKARISSQYSELFQEGWNAAET